MTSNHQIRNQVNRLDTLYYIGDDQIAEDAMLAQIRGLDYLLFHPQNDQLQDYSLEFDDRHRVTAFTHLDEQGRPSPNVFGYVTAHCQYVTDSRGRVRQVTLTYRDARQQPCLDSFGHDHTTYSLDTQRRVTQIDWRDADGFGHTRDNESRRTLEWDKEVLRVGYFDNLGQLSSRFQYVFDEARQYIRMRMGLDDEGTLTTDDDGGNGSYIERDPQTHRPVALWNINISRQRVPAHDGVAYWRLQFPAPRVYRHMYFNANGVPTANYEGVFGYETEQNEYGLVVRETNLDADGQPMPNQAGVVVYEFQHDALGRIADLRVYGLEHQPVVSAVGVHHVQYTYDDAPATRSFRVQKFDAQGAPVTGFEHRLKYIRILSPTEHLVYFLDRQGKLFGVTPGSYYGYRRLFDKQGRKISEQKVLLDHPDTPNLTWRPNPKGIYICRTEYDDRHRLATTSMYDVDGQPTDEDEGVFRFQTQLDHWGRIVRTLLFGCDGLPTSNELGEYGTGREYDDEGNVTWVSLGRDGKPKANRRGYTYYLIEKDSFGRDVREFWYDAKRRPYVKPEGHSGIMTVYRPNVREVIFLDANGDPCEINTGAAIVHNEYDDQEREVYEVRYNLDGDKVRMSQGHYAVRTQYHDDDSNHRTIIFLDADDQPVNNDRGFAYREQWLDDEDYIRREMRYDADHLPAVDEDGVCGNTFEQLDPPLIPGGASQVVGQLDSDGNYLADPTGLVFWRTHTDSLGRLVLKQWLDINHERCRDASGTYAIQFSYEYDDVDGSRPSEHVFLNRKLEPTNNIWGFSRHLMIYDSKGNMKSIFFDKSGAFVTPKQLDEYEDY